MFLNEITSDSPYFSIERTHSWGQEFKIIFDGRNQKFVKQTQTCHNWKAKHILDVNEIFSLLIAASVGLCGQEHTGSPRKRVHQQSLHRAGEQNSLSCLLAAAFFLSLPFCLPSEWAICAALAEVGEKPFNPYKGPGSGFWCFRSFKEVTEVPLSWLSSTEMWQMGILPFMANKPGFPLQ